MMWNASTDESPILQLLQVLSFTFIIINPKSTLIQNYI